MQRTYFLVLSLLSAVYLPSLQGMHESIKKQIEQVETTLENELRRYRGEEMKVGDAYTKYSCQLADIVQKAGTLMPNQDKLQHLIGDHHYTQRKHIVKQMIEIEKINPNTITINCFSNPLSEAVSYKDINFIAYLLRHGAKPDIKIFEQINQSTETARLLSLSNKLQ